MRYVDEQISRLKVPLTDACEPMLAPLARPDLEDLVLNSDSVLWQRSRSSGWEAIATIERDAAYDIVQNVAAINRRELKASCPVVETIFPLGNCRFIAIIPPVTRNPVFALRAKTAGELLFSDYERLGVLTQLDDPLNCSLSMETFIARVRGLPHAEVLRQAVMARQTVLYVGPTGSGKTTIADTHMTEIGLGTPGDRVVYIEDTSELACNIPNSVDLLTCEEIGIDILRCVRIAMRLRPKRIVVGEVRGAEAHALLKAWNTGHPGGIATVHADDAYGGLTRMESLVAESTSTPQQDLIAQAISLVVFIEEEPRVPAGRKVREILAVTGYDRSRGRYETTSL